MYNLLIGLTRGEVDASRLLEYTSDDLRQYFAPGMDQVRIERLLNLPTLLMPETGTIESHRLLVLATSPT